MNSQVYLTLLRFTFDPASNKMQEMIYFDQLNHEATAHPASIFQTRVFCNCLLSAQFTQQKWDFFFH